MAVALGPSSQGLSFPHQLQGVCPFGFLLSLGMGSERAGFCLAFSCPPHPRQLARPSRASVGQGLDSSPQSVLWETCRGEMTRSLPCGPASSAPTDFFACLFPHIHSCHSLAAPANHSDGTLQRGLLQRDAGRGHQPGARPALPARSPGQCSGEAAAVPCSAGAGS